MLLLSSRERTGGHQAELLLRPLHEGKTSPGLPDRGGRHHMVLVLLHGLDLALGHKLLNRSAILTHTYPIIVLALVIAHVHLHGRKLPS
jgi:hypothetical protein